MDYYTTITPARYVHVKVMRSYDYCHFEVGFSELISNGVDPELLADDIRKSAAKLVDKAVNQYKQSQQYYDRREADSRSRAHYARRLEMLKQAHPEGERDPKIVTGIGSLEAQIRELDANPMPEIYSYEDTTDPDKDTSNRPKFDIEELPFN